MTKHTKEQCFKLVGYPDWWADGHKKGKGGKAAAAVGNPETTSSGGNSENTPKIAGEQGSSEKGGRCCFAAVKEEETGAVAGIGFEVTLSNPPISKSSFLKPKAPNIAFENPRFFSPQILGLLEKSQILGNTVNTPHAPSLENKEPKKSCNSGKANMATKNNQEKESWIFDCGATDTMTYEKSDMCSVSTPQKFEIHTANGEVLQVKGGGTIQISENMKLPNCLYVPSLSHKLLSISHVTKELNCVVLMHPTFCILQDIRTGKIIGRGTERQGLYYVDEVTRQGTVMLAHGSTDREAWLWHRRLGHSSSGYLHRLFPKLFPTNKVLNCETCFLAKSHRHTFKPNDTKVDSPFLLIHSDVWGPAKVMGGGGQNFWYFVTFIDDCTRMTWIYLLKNKSEVFSKFTWFYAMIKTQYKSDIQILRSDNGGGGGVC
ncbi:putative RNA-directed DNA polymerase [Helianthus annuus]|nr:putative RNA-directed DNA polymerase [Helianthus annuus]